MVEQVHRTNIPSILEEHFDMVEQVHRTNIPSILEEHFDMVVQINCSKSRYISLLFKHSQNTYKSGYKYYDYEYCFVLNTLSVGYSFV